MELKIDGEIVDVKSLTMDGKERIAKLLELPEPRYITRAWELIQNIGAGLKQHDMNKLCDLEVTLHVGDESVSMDVPTALDYLCNDIYWNEELNWADAERATVRTL